MSINLNTEEIILGINWGAIKETGWFSAIEYHPVDIDIICYEVGTRNELIDTIYYGNRKLTWGTLSDDDMFGDMSDDDNEDNEWLFVHTKKLQTGHKLLLSIINYSEQYLSDITHLNYRIYTGSVNQVDQLHYRNDLKHIPNIEKAKGMFLGIIEMQNSKYVFNEKNTKLTALDNADQYVEILTYL